MLCVFQAQASELLARRVSLQLQGLNEILWDLQRSGSPLAHGSDLGGARLSQSRVSMFIQFLYSGPWLSHSTLLFCTNAA